jgi:2-hydroxy-3-keto-5-methylthiopentenyl-1-phosphate phosphatase
MVTAEDIVAEINGQYKKDMNQQVDAMMDGSLDKLIRNLDELSYTVSNIERQAQEIVTEVNKNL